MWAMNAKINYVFKNIFLCYDLFRYPFLRYYIKSGRNTWLDNYHYLAE